MESSWLRKNVDPQRLWPGINLAQIDISDQCQQDVNSVGRSRSAVAMAANMPYSHRPAVFFTQRIILDFTEIIDYFYSNNKIT